MGSDGWMITLHQVVHGYRDGHRLLQSSKKFTSEAERVMLMLSDMSGPSMLRGFESYLTGYSLPTDDVYAFARTWYAPEMGRPGCVWTHTLLIATTDLAYIQNFHSLVKLFARPSKNQPLEAYKKPITLSSESDSSIEDRELTTGAASLGLLSRLLTSLYAKDAPPVFLSAEDSKQFEELTLRVWSQQWPELRTGFHFCTGSLANRKAHGEPFDLQVAPKKYVSKLYREAPSGIFVDYQSVSDLDDASLWAERAAADLSATCGGKFRRFLWEFGPSIHGGRATYSSLAQVFDFVERIREDHLLLPNLTGFITKAFPSPKQAKKLKRALYGAQTSGEAAGMPYLTEAELLGELSLTKHYRSFDSSSLDIRRRALELLTVNYIEAKELTIRILTSKLTPLGEKFLAGIASAISVEEALILLRLNPDHLFIFLKNNPALALAPELWQLDATEQRKIFSFIIQEFKPVPATLCSIVTAMLEAGSDVLANEIVTSLGTDAVVAVLDWAEQSERSAIHIGKGWIDLLRNHSSEVLTWIAEKQPRGAILPLVSSLLDPNSRQVVELGTEPWLRLAHNASAKLEGNVLVDPMVFLLSLGFNNPWPSGAELVAQSFQAVHDATENNSLSDWSWRRLQLHAPSGAWIGEWDRCKRLRHALIDKFIHYRWPAEYLLQSVRRTRTWHQVVDECDSTGRSRKLLRRLAQQVAHGEVYATDEQRRSLHNFL